MGTTYLALAGPAGAAWVRMVLQETGGIMLVLVSNMPLEAVAAVPGGPERIGGNNSSLYGSFSASANTGGGGGGGTLL